MFGDLFRLIFEGDPNEADTFIAFLKGMIVNNVEADEFLKF